MHRYFIKTPWLVQQFFLSYTWRMPAADNAIYLTFDDGPHPTITPWVLDQLKKYNAQATFFCIGKNVAQHPDIYQRIITEGHAVGNHTQHHLNGWKTDTEAYLKDVAKASTIIDSTLFRPPYGKIKRRQAKSILHGNNLQKMQVIMWDVLSADFDKNMSPEKCLQHVMQHATAGSIIVFHDSEKAYRNLFYVLPKVLQLFSEKGSLLRKIGE
jgi:peptidoglycan/xylan/chitin deacetylase (PgdA/CDA1 family)